jgi:hypothetical protein
MHIHKPVLVLVHALCSLGVLYAALLFRFAGHPTAAAGTVHACMYACQFCVGVLACVSGVCAVYARTCR